MGLCHQKQYNDEQSHPSPQPSRSSPLPGIERARSMSDSSIYGNSNETDNIQKLLQIISMGDLYWAEEIGDCLEDGTHHWHYIKQRLWGDLNINQEELHKIWIEYEQYLEGKCNTMQNICSNTKIIEEIPKRARVSTMVSIPILMGYDTQSTFQSTLTRSHRTSTFPSKGLSSIKITNLSMNKSDTKNKGDTTRSTTPGRLSSFQHHPVLTPYTPSCSKKSNKAYDITTRKLTQSTLEDYTADNRNDLGSKRYSGSVLPVTPNINDFSLRYEFSNIIMNKATETKKEDDTIDNDNDGDGNADDEKKMNVNDESKDVTIDKLNFESQTDQYCLSSAMPPNDSNSPSKEERKSNDTDCGDMDKKMNELRTYCKPFKRIEFVLKTYHASINESSWSETKLSDMIQFQHKYGHQQLFDDFCHIKMMHIDANNNKTEINEDDENKCKCLYDNIGKEICSYFQEIYPCDMKTCNSFLLHCGQKIKDKNAAKQFEAEEEERIIEDISFQQQLVSMHAYFLHSAIKFGINVHQNDAEKDIKIDEYGRYWKRRMFLRGYHALFHENYENDEDSVCNTNTNEMNSDENDEKTETNSTIKHHAYAGKKEDNMWWNDVISEDDNKQCDGEIYQILAKNMGVFRWQNPHGFIPAQNRETAHYKPKWNNIKQEALNNEYEQLGKDNWNQTLRKSTIFFKSWARKQIRTKYNGFFNDQVTGQNAEWKVGEEITMQEVVTLKLYTDFDKLQFALKKCFRFETFEDILKRKIHQRAQEDDEKCDDNDLEAIVAKKKEYEKTKEDLKNRLEQFYHWRGGLLIVLNKFGTKLNHENNMVLYHGVNAKMIIKQSQTFAFNGPLSTTSSYPVARTFATAKGMVLKLLSHFPRLNYCNAFDASLISDYPEEQEWLVGFMYARLLEVRARKLIDGHEPFSDLINKIPLSSWIRQQFFVIHLFGEQIFSMSEHLERILAQFLKVNRRECCDEKQAAKYENQYNHFNDSEMDVMCDQLCDYAHTTMTNKYKMKGNRKKSKIALKENQTKEDIIRGQKIVPILWNKFNEFRENPNFRQRVKLDTISNHLKRFFMEEIEEKDIKTADNKWSISFDEINRVYPNVKEIHFINQYKFDDQVLDNLIKRIQRKDQKNTINKIVFLYYNYKRNDEQNKPLNYRIFQDPDKLNENLIGNLKELGWQIKHNKNGETGYKIRIYKLV